MPNTAEGIADRLVEHFLPQLVLKKMPSLTVIDTVVGTEVSLHDSYKELVNRTRVDTIDVAGHEFTLTHFVLTPGRKAEHAVALTANDRRVEDWRNLHNDIPDLKGSLSKAIEYAGGDGELDAHLAPYAGKDHVYYAGYLSGPYLNSHVDPSTRSSFRFPQESTLVENGGGVTEDTLRVAVIDRVKDYLEPFLAPMRVATERRVVDLLETELPQFRAVFERRPDVIGRISASDTNSVIERTLYDAHSDLRRDAIETASDLQNATAEELESGRFSGFAELWNDLQKDELALYVLHRKKTLDIIEAYLQAPPERKVGLEGEVHKLIYPMRSTSSQVDPDAQNLWLIDERLAFHRFLASDEPMSTYEVQEIDSDRRPDLAVFNSRVALVGEEDGPYASISIFEFKRPRRDDFKSEESGKDPFKQLYDYVDSILEGKEQTVNHRTILVNERTRFYLYLVADLTPTLKKIIEQRGLQPTADGDGYYFVNRTYNTYVEVMGWDKLVRDAKKRNEGTVPQARSPEACLQRECHSRWLSKNKGRGHPCCPTLGRTRVGFSSAVRQRSARAPSSPRRCSRSPPPSASPGA